MKKALFAGGGTGGHLFAAQAIAEEFQKKFPENEILFVGAKRGIESTLVPKMGYKIKLLDIRPLKGQGVFGLMLSLFLLPISILKCLFIQLMFRPDIVVGVGGYASGPMLFAAKICNFLVGSKISILEQNSRPGLTNRILSKFSDRVFVTFESAKSTFPTEKTKVVGNPIRKKLLEQSVGRTGFSRPGNMPGLLIFGGSQGAVGMNSFLLEVLRKSKDLLGQIKNGEVYFIHQVGKLDFDRMKSDYEDLGLYPSETFHLLPFIDNMDEAYRACDLVICRAGAGALTEVSLLGKPSIFIPLPTAADNHQEHNARELEALGGALVYPQKIKDPKEASIEIENLLSNPDKLKEMSEKIKTWANPNAASDLLDLAL